MRYRIKQWFAVLLALMMTLTTLPVTALAESVTPTEETKVEQVQALIDALPDTESITADNRADVEEQLNAIDEAKQALEDEELDELDVTRYMAAVKALLALDDMAGADIPTPLESSGSISGIDWTLDDSGTLTLTVDGGSGVLDVPSFAQDGDLWDKNSVKKIIIEGDITAIGRRAFSEYSFLEEISLPDSLTTIGEHAFERCRMLQLTELPTGVTTIESHAFYGCERLQLTKLPAGVTTIKEYAFSSCRALALTELPAGVKEIENSAFSDCYSLALKKLPEDLKTIGNNAFSGCDSLALRSIPEGVTSIGNFAFLNCNGLTYLTLPESLNSMGLYVFQGCQNLTSLTFLGDNAPVIDPNTFKYANGLQEILIPEGATGYTAANYWPEEKIRYQITANIPEGAPITLYISSTDTVRSVKEQIEASKGIPIAVQVITFSGNPLDDSETLGECGVTGGSTLELSLSYAPGGDGTANTPYLISDKETMEAFRYYINDMYGASNGGENQYFRLTENIELDGEEWTPIGSDDIRAFRGTFDGGNFTVSGLYMGGNASYVSYAGLFGVVSGGTVKDVEAEGLFLLEDYASYVGGIAGMLRGGTIENATNDVTISGNCSIIGGIVGRSEGGAIRGCVNEADLSRDGQAHYVGGIVGDGSSLIENCKNRGTIGRDYTEGESIDLSYVGGIAGELRLHGDDVLKNCVNFGDVFGDHSVGGIVGYCESGISDCQNKGSVSGNYYVGGIVGTTYNIIQNCSNTGAVTGRPNRGFSASYVGGIAGINDGDNDRGGSIMNCWNSAPVGEARYAGGIAGVNYTGGTAENCYNRGAVSGMQNAGGIMGQVLSNRAGAVKNCYSVGDVSSEAGSAGGITGSNEDGAVVENCYYLDTCGAGGAGTEKNADQFASGEVAYLLQSGQDTLEPQVWGQTVNSGYPELTASEDKKVFKITGKVEDQADVVWYSNSSASLPAAEPTKEGYTFAGWSKTDGGSVDFTAGTPVSEDMTVYAVFVNKRVDGTGTLTMKDYTCGDTSVTPEAKSDTNTGAVTITYKQKGADDNTYTSDKPTTAGEYTVKAVFPANQNYNELTLTADFKITHQFNAGWEQTEDGEYHLCACGVGLLLETKELTEVPVGLKQNPDVDTVEEIEQVLVEKVATGDHYVIYDVELEAWTGDEWQIITPENLPEEGVAITIPYPKGTNSRYTFTVVHMFTTAGDGHVPGDTETLNATNEADGIHFTVKSFSPIIVGWKTGNLTVTVTDTGEGAGSAQQWQFRVELDDDTIDGTFGDMEFTGGVATFTLESGQSLTARDLPVGVKYTVTELEADQNGYTTTYTDDSGFITSEQDMVAAFINDKPAQAKPDKPSDDPDTPTDNPPDTPTDNPPDTPTDTPPDTPTSNNPNDTPKTGDESHLALWLSLIILSLLGITVTVLTPIIGRKKIVSAHGKHMRK